MYNNTVNDIQIRKKQSLENDPVTEDSSNTEDTSIASYEYDTQKILDPLSVEINNLFKDLTDRTEDARNSTKPMQNWMEVDLIGTNFMSHVWDLSSEQSSIVHKFNINILNKYKKESSLFYTMDEENQKDVIDVLMGELRRINPYDRTKETTVTYTDVDTLDKLYILNKINTINLTDKVEEEFEKCNKVLKRADKEVERYNKVLERFSLEEYKDIPMSDSVDDYETKFLEDAKIYHIPKEFMNSLNECVSRDTPIDNLNEVVKKYKYDINGKLTGCTYLKPTIQTNFSPCVSG